MIKVKVTLMSAEEPEIRRMTLENQPDFAEFERKVSELFGKTTGTYTLYWKDDESDLITMSSDEEFREATKSANEETLRIFLQRIEDHSRKEGTDHRGDNEMDNLTSDEFCPLRWQRRRRHWKSFDNGQSPVSFPRLRKQLMNDHPPSEKRTRRYLRRKVENREKFDHPGDNNHGYRCGRRQQWSLTCQDGDQIPVSSRTCPKMTGGWYRWNRDRWSLRHDQRPVRHFGASVVNENCHSRRDRENVRGYCREKKSCRRARSAPPTRLYGKNLREFSLMMHGKGKRCRRSASVAVCRREKDDEMLASKRCRPGRNRNRKSFLRFKVNGLPIHVCESSTDSAGGKEKKCLGRRCKSYRRRATMLANEE
ncbi:uncharacterized protein LOC133171651 [Saccostrea echinata]|uniref:uncharacterized protein LOC133171651 n=1 Tax=Saccostrea echinata TaxID=191078 RepID=UPI002A7ECC90|nr:uncharacterized protein LOC133171651 [Saccostrea echinata]